MNKPNFFIVGAPKCGTTALSEYLQDHPNIYISPIKEPNYFADDFRAGNLKPGSLPVNNLEEYLALFNDAKENHQAIGEASATYLYSYVAIANLYQFNPQAKIIVMLRNPIDIASSFHSQIVFNLGENEPDFEKAWQLQESRKEGKNIPPLCGNLNVLQYRRISQIGSQLQNLMNIFSREQVKIVLFNNFKQNPAGTYHEVVDFLGLPPHDKQDFPIINNNKTHKSALIARLSQKPPQFISKLVQAIKSTLKTDSLGIVNSLTKLNNKQQTRSPLSTEFRQKLILEYESEISKVEVILNQDLPHWRN